MAWGSHRPLRRRVLLRRIVAKRSKMYYLYILKSLSRNWHYIGSTSNVSERLAKHNFGGVKSTKPYRPLKLIYQETFTTNKEARKREIFLKRTTKARIELLEGLEKGPIV